MFGCAVTCTRSGNDKLLLVDDVRGTRGKALFELNQIEFEGKVEETLSHADLICIHVSSFVKCSSSWPSLMKNLIEGVGENAHYQWVKMRSVNWKQYGQRFTRIWDTGGYGYLGSETHSMSPSAE